jgi:hypothetical protein
MHRLSKRTAVLSAGSLQRPGPTLAGEPSGPPAVSLTRSDGLSAILVRFRAVVACDALDTALAQGADPACRPELAIRAAQLVRPRHRRALARTFRGLVSEAGRPPVPIRSTAVVICRHQIRAQAADLLALADRLDNPRLTYASGIAIAQRLITDVVESPVHVACDAGRLGHLARRAVAAMDDPTVHVSGD